jgi:hypothetical protein
MSPPLQSGVYECEEVKTVAGCKSRETEALVDRTKPAALAQERAAPARQPERNRRSCALAPLNVKSYDHP